MVVVSSVPSFLDSFQSLNHFLPAVDPPYNSRLINNAISSSQTGSLAQVLAELSLLLMQLRCGFEL